MHDLILLCHQYVKCSIITCHTFSGRRTPSADPSDRSDLKSKRRSRSRSHSRSKSSRSVSPTRDRGGRKRRSRSRGHYSPDRRFGRYVWFQNNIVVALLINIL